MQNFKIYICQSIITVNHVKWRSWYSCRHHFVLPNIGTLCDPNMAQLFQSFSNFRPNLATYTRFRITLALGTCKTEVWLNKINLAKILTQFLDIVKSLVSFLWNQTNYKWKKCFKIYCLQMFENNDITYRLTFKKN